jgi:hypothetical protein
VNTKRSGAAGDSARGHAADRISLFMLPGAGMRAQDFFDHGLVAAVRAHNLPADVDVLAPDVGLYLDGTIAQWIHAEAVAPAQRRGRRRLWMLGISLGGMGALLHARAFEAAVEGIVLLAPFLGTRGLIAEVARAGGLSSWEPGACAPNDGERKLLSWLKGQVPARDRLRLFLGYGRSDRFAPGHALLARHLPSQQVRVTEGGHDWDTWSRLWQEFLLAGVPGTGMMERLDATSAPRPACGSGLPGTTE